MEAGGVTSRENQQFEVRQPTRDNAPKSRGCLSIVLALFLAIFLFAALYMVTSGAVRVAAIVAGVIFLFAAFHYFVWGWWLSSLIRQQVEEEERER